MDFVEGLAKVHHKSVILSVVDWFYKYAHFIARAHLCKAKSRSMGAASSVDTFSGI